jgi:tRNA(Ile)-lysidine synthase
MAATDPTGPGAHAARGPDQRSGGGRGRPAPAVAAVRRAVREALADVEPGETVVVACSGGTDSMALAAAARFESRAAGWSPVAVVVDHGLQPGSAKVGAEVAGRLEGLGVPANVVTVEVDPDAPGGPEATARSARYVALDRAADELSARCVLLGHTRDDQAETVLLGLARGSGARSLSGMPPVSGRYRRPLLGLARADTEQACAAERIEIWHDPHNADPGFARVRVRREVLPALEAHLGPGIAAALSRTARLLRDDADALDAFAEVAREDCCTTPTDAGTAPLDVGCLQTLLPALRRRVIRRSALDAGCPATDLTAGHVDAVEELVTRWHGQQGVDLPGPVRAVRAGGTLLFRAGAVGG